QQQVHITIYQAAKDAPWRNASLKEAAGKAADFSQYTAVHHETRKADVGVTELLDQMYDKLQGADMPKLSISDIIRVNDRCFYVDDVGFQEVTIHPLKDKQFLLPIASSEVESIKQAQKESVGAEKFEAYQKRFQKVFLEGAQATAETCIGNPVKQYSRFIYNSSIERGLSSIRPCDQKAWQEADRTFIRDSCVNALGEPSAIAAAARVVQANSPYAAVSDDRNYGTTLGTDFMKSPEYRAIREENREIAQVVRH
uniref:YodL domain-containing protein n=1 Tax=Mitsuokella jalaludinii TaxID=187979 RepID=UPI002FDAD71C